MTVLTQDELEAATLAFLFDHANIGAGKIGVNIVAAKLQAPIARVNFALQALERKRLARATHNALSGSIYGISEHGYRGLESLRVAPESGETEKTGGYLALPTLPANFVLDDAKRTHLVRELDKAERKLSDLDVGQEVSSQARAYILAAKALSEAPDPPTSLIWDIVSRANSLAGIASLFVAIVALFH